MYYLVNLYDTRLTTRGQRDYRKDNGKTNKYQITRARFCSKQYGSFFCKFDIRFSAKNKYTIEQQQKKKSFCVIKTKMKKKRLT